MGPDPKTLLSGLRARQGWPLLATAVCVVASAVAVSCGEGKDRGGNTAPKTDLRTVVGGNLITDQDVASQPQGSPQRALFSFFQAVQYRDDEEALSLVARSERGELSPETIRGLIAMVGGSLGRPRIVAARVTGNRARVRTVVLGFAPGKSAPTSGTPVTFPLRNAESGWVLSDLSYLAVQAREISNAERRNRGQPGRP